jgi:Protein of unknown function (DUF3616)
MAIMVGLTASALWPVCAGAQARNAEIIEFRGICDASAAVALDENRIIVGDDEAPWLSVYRLDDQAFEATFPLGTRGSQMPAFASGASEADIEAATVLNGRIVWLSSHGRNRSGKVRSERYQFFASHRLNLDGTLSDRTSAPIFRGLVAAILKTPDPAYASLRHAIGNLEKQDKAFAPKNRGFNIEGMTAARDGRSVLIGMRNPLLGGKAIVFQIKNVEELLDGQSLEPKLGDVSSIDLGGRGVRDIAWSPAHDAYLIAAGQIDDDHPGPGFAIFAWSESGAVREIRAFGDINRDYARFHPEAVVPLKERHNGNLVPSKKVLLLSDDGTKQIAGGSDCKSATDSQKSFRGIIRTVD